MSTPAGATTTSLTLGLHSAARLVFELRHCSMTSAVKEMMRQKDFVAPHTKQKVLYPILRTVSSLEFPDGGPYDQICAAAIMNGLELCPAEMGPLLRLAWQSQPKTAAKFRFAMEPIPVTQSGKRIFFLSHTEKGLGLDSEDVLPDDFFESSSVFVFASPTAHYAQLPWKIA